MLIKDIILPPAFSRKYIDESTGEERESPQFSIAGWEYGLTLVKNKTVLQKEDINEPKGEKVKDFTFDENVLTKALEDARKRRGDEFVTMKDMGADGLPRSRRPSFGAMNRKRGSISTSV